jgi:hypothetical protein
MYFPAPQSGIEREYVYQASWRMILLGVGLFAPGAVILGFRAANNHRGLIIDGVVPLSADQATVFYWGLVVVSVVFAAFALLKAVQRLTGPPGRIAFTHSALIIPKMRFGHGELAIPYGSIISLRMLTVRRRKFLRIRHAGGNSNLSEGYVESNSVFAEICTLLSERVKQAANGDLPRMKPDPNTPSPGPASFGRRY